MRLSVSIARGFEGRGLSLEDLVCEGNRGLLLAVDRFDPERGCRFSSFATPTIRGAIMHALSNSSTVVRLPMNLRQRVGKWKRLARALAFDLGREPSSDEIADAAGVAGSYRDIVPKALAAARGASFLDCRSRPDARESDAASTMDQTGHESREESPAAGAEAREVYARVREAVRRLPPRDRKIVVASFFRGASATSIAKTLGLSSARVSQCRRRALRDLRKGLLVACG